MTQSAAQPVAKTIASALANADENEGLSREDMYVATISADGAPLRKWRRFGARGRFKPIVRRSSHITVVLEER
jgi:large subunit ribosomal protein L22